MTIIGKRAREASRLFAQATTAEKNALLRDVARTLNKNQLIILAANKRDVRRQGVHPLADRLMLTRGRIKEMIKSLYAVTRLADPVGESLFSKQLPNGLAVTKIRVPLGVVGVIYESRPNVTVEIASLTLKTGNAVILKGGKEAAETNAVLVRLMQEVLKKHGQPVYTIQLLNASQRSLVKEMLRLNRYIDVVIPRGGTGLISFVRDTATVPVIETGAGVCHTYVESSANVQKAAAIVYNAKTQRPTVCNALDTLVADKKILPRLLKPLAPQLAQANVAIKADPHSYALLTKLYPRKLLLRATKKDFGREFLGLTMSIKTVSSSAEAFDFIEKFSSGHSESVCTDNQLVAKRFLKRIDAAAVFVNTSTRFTDGFQFGLGAELGISTQKLHARGPMGLTALTSVKWIIKSNWRTRP